MIVSMYTSFATKAGPVKNPIWSFLFFLVFLQTSYINSKPDFPLCAITYILSQ